MMRYGSICADGTWYPALPGRGAWWLSAYGPGHHASCPVPVWGAWHAAPAAGGYPVGPDHPWGLWRAASGYEPVYDLGAWGHALTPGGYLPGHFDPRAWHALSLAIDASGRRHVDLPHAATTARAERQPQAAQPAVGEVACEPASTPSAVGLEQTARSLAEMVAEISAWLRYGPPADECGSAKEMLGELKELKELLDRIRTCADLCLEWQEILQVPASCRQWPASCRQPCGRH